MPVSFGIKLFFTKAAQPSVIWGIKHETCHTQKQLLNLLKYCFYFFIMKYWDNVCGRLERGEKG